MSIFDHNGRVRPYLGADQRDRGKASPYLVGMRFLASHLANANLERIRILEGLIKLREELRMAGIKDGFQWIDGSFCEDQEGIHGKPPADIDVVTFATGASALPPELADRRITKPLYLVDHFVSDLEGTAEQIVEDSVYWYRMWAHTRQNQWKGFFQVSLNDERGDAAASKILSKRRKELETSG